MKYDVFLEENGKLTQVGEDYSPGSSLKQFTSFLRKQIYRGHIHGKIVVKDKDGNITLRRVWSNLSWDNRVRKRKPNNITYL